MIEEYIVFSMFYLSARNTLTLDMKNRSVAVNVHLKNSCWNPIKKAMYFRDLCDLHIPDC